MKLCFKCKENEVSTKSTYCKKCHNEYMREWYRSRHKTGDDIVKNRKYRMISSAKKRAKRDNLDFNISIDDISIPDVCPALNIKISLTNEHIADDSPTLDKIDPLLGYVKGNVTVISCKANRIKTNANAEEIRMVANWLDEII